MLKNMSALGYSVAQGLVTARNASQRKFPILRNSGVRIFPNPGTRRPDFGNRKPEIGSGRVALARPPPARHRSRSGEAGGSDSPQAYAGRAQAKRDGLVFAIQQCVNEARYLFCPIGTASLYPR